MADQQEDFTVETLKAAARDFALLVNQGTVFGPDATFLHGGHIEREFLAYLEKRFHLPAFTSTSPGADLDIGVTLVWIRTRESLSGTRIHDGALPYQDAYQQLFGIGRDMLVFIYQLDRSASLTSGAALAIQHVLYMPREQTGDKRVADRITQILNDERDSEAKKDELVQFFAALHPSPNSTQRTELAYRVLSQPPGIGALRYRWLSWRISVSEDDMSAFDLLGDTASGDDTNEGGAGDPDGDSSLS